jgi:alanyl-tRNA synthetase (EC 6.1.1.7)
MKSAELRSRFLQFFAQQGHTIVPSSSLVPAQDPTLLFTNSGMVQFKDVFLGKESRSYTRATSSQRSVRAGGKHNDLENVGYTARHHTFFEMLGNFSFGDYFKREAIHFAWTFLTQELRLPVDRLWVTVYHDDDEAARIWLEEIGVEPARLTRIASSDNFWQMGDTGPCGPCSEIFYDHGPEVAGGPPGTPDADGDRYIEIWNLVFMQYNRDDQGVLHPLPRPSVDTGMGLERIAAILQGVHSNYDIDLFRELIAAAQRHTGARDSASQSLRVIADHIRSCAFLVVDGIIPSNEGRGYVLRRIIRRAIRHGYQLGQKQPFFYCLVADLVAVMGSAYPELIAAQTRVSAVLLQEEERFAETFEKGLMVLETALQHTPTHLSGDTLFKLYDTYGFPLDLTADIARERRVTLDVEGFERIMQEQRTRARAASRFTSRMGVDYHGEPTRFVGYDSLEEAATVVALYSEGSPVQQLLEGQGGIVVLDTTPFYAESGGQVGDQGQMLGDGIVFSVEDTQKIQADVFGHHGHVLQGNLRVGDRMNASVRQDLRCQAALNHSVTHLLHAALRAELGDHVAQRGSLVDAQRTRFDFSHGEPLTLAQMQAVESRVNAQIRANVPVQVATMSYDQAIQQGATALFGEKYGAEVRVVGMGPFSTELCGGTHVSRTGDIGLFRLVTQSGVAAGIRRVEGITGADAMALMQHEQSQLLTLAGMFHVQASDLVSRLQQVQEDSLDRERQLAHLNAQLAANTGLNLLQHAKRVGEVQVLVTTLDKSSAKGLRDLWDALKFRGSLVVLLATVQDGKVALLAGVSSDLTPRIKAGELVGKVAQQIGGKGGGRPDLAQAGGSLPDALPGALAEAQDWIETRLLS